MSMFADHLQRFTSGHPGERLYMNLCNNCEALLYNGRQPRALLIGEQSLANIEAFLSERNNRPMTLQDAGFGAGRKIPIILDDENPHGVTTLIEGQ